MDVSWMGWGLLLGIVIDVALAAFFWQHIARKISEIRHCKARYAALPVVLDDDDGFNVPREEDNSQGVLTNSVAGLPMLDHALSDVAGNPYGSDFSRDWGMGASHSTCSHGLLINPASGLPMLDDIVDVAGNPYGCDFNHHVETGWTHPAFDSFGSSSFDSGCGAHDW